MGENNFCAWEECSRMEFPSLRGGGWGKRKTLNRPRRAGTHKRTITSVEGERNTRVRAKIASLDKIRHASHALLSLTKITDPIKDHL